ncbi:conserved hypothetical protein [Ricinus communis]|uniref:RNase H type-1 domain-containing protein n=1 Tax=Ricinus communis TaxID=3988 RepID=B9SU28_RICCO|nr:conserved hypothetical protein [Ricinus communis]
MERRRRHLTPMTTYSRREDGEEDILHQSSRDLHCHVDCVGGIQAVKLNSYGAVKGMGQGCFARGLIRDDQGRWMQGFAMNVGRVVNYMEFGNQELEVESDSLDVMRLVNGKDIPCNADRRMDSILKDLPIENFLTFLCLYLSIRAGV